LRESRLDKAQEVLLEEAPRKLYKREWGWLLAQTEPEDFALTNHNFYDAVFSPDGDEFAIGSRDVSGAGYVATYSTYSGDRVSSAVTNKQIVWNLAFSPDGKYIATASNDSHVSILDRQTNKVVKSLGRKQIVRDVQFSPDGKLLAACARDKTVRLWTVPDFQTSLTIYLQNESPTELSFSPDSRYLVLGNLEGHPRIYDLAASAAAHSFAVKKTSGTQTAAAAPAQNTYGVEVCKLGGKMERVLACTFLGDGKGLAVGSTDGRTFIYNWPPRPGKRVLQPRHVILSDGSYPTQVASSPDGQVLYIGNDNGHIMAVNTQTGEEILSFTVDQPLWKMSLCRGGHRLLTTTRWSVRMFNLDRLRDEVRISPVDLGSSQTSGAIPIRAATVFNPRDKTWSADTEWRTTSGLSLVETNSRRKFLVKSDYLVHSPDGKQAVKIDPETLHWRAFETSSGKTLNSNGRHLCTGAVFSPDSKLCLIQYDRTKSVLYRTRDWSVVYEIVPKISVSSSIFTRDSKKLIVGDIDGQIVERDAATGAVLRQLLPPRSGNALDMAISRRENLLAVGLDLDRAIVIDLDTGDQISTMTGHVRYIHALAFAPDETRLVTMSRDSTVKMWDIATGRELVTLFRFKDGVVPLGISFSANGRRISVVTSDRQLVGTDVFPWSLKAYGNDHLPPVERVELWKRRQRLPLLKRK